MKKRIKLLVYMILLSTILTSCKNEEVLGNETVAVLEECNFDDNSLSLSVNTISKVEEEKEEIIEEEKEPVILEEKEVVIDELTKNYLEYFKSLNFEYNYADYYTSDSVINSMNSVTLNPCDYTFDNTLDVCETIINNSRIYLQSYPECVNVFDNPDNAVALYKIINKVLTDSSNNINDDAHKFSSLVIVYGETFDCAMGMYFDDTNVIVLNDSMIDTLVFYDGVTKNDAFIYVLGHEINHVRQNLCDCNKNSVIHDVRYSPYESFILESSSESSLYNQNIIDIGSYTYTDEREKEAELLLLALFSDKSIDAYYNAVFDTDLTALYSYLNIEDSNIKTFYNILYNMDALLLRNMLPFNIVDDEYSFEGYIETLDKIGYTYKLDLLNLCMQRLMIYSSVNNIEYEEHLVLYNLIKNTLLGKYEASHFSDEFISSYIALDNTYIDYLSNYYNIDKSKIRNDEYIDARITGVAINELASNLELTNPSIGKKAKYYLEKYPLLNNILGKTLVYNSNRSIILNDCAYSMFSR